MRPRVYFLSGAFGLFLLFGSTVFLLLPYLVTTYLLPDLLHSLPLSTKEVSLSRISPWRIEGSVRMADTTGLSISIPRFQLHFTPSSLFHRQADRLVLDSLSVTARLRDGELMTGEESDSQTASLPANYRDSLALMASLRTIVFHRSTITLLTGAKSQPGLHYLVDGEIGIDLIDRDGKRQFPGELSAALSVRGDATAAVELKARLEENSEQLSARIQLADLARINRLIPAIPALSGTGELNVTLNTSNLATINSFQARAHLTDAVVQGSHFTIHTVPEKTGLVEISGDPRQASYLLREFALTAPENILTSVDGTFDLAEKTFTGAGTLFPGRIGHPFGLKFQGALRNGGADLNYTVKADTFALNPEVSFQGLQLEGVASVDDFRILGDIDLRIPKIVDRGRKLAAEQISLSMPFSFALPGKAIMHTAQMPEKTEKGHLKVTSLQYRGSTAARLDVFFQQQEAGWQTTARMTTPINKNLAVTCKGEVQLPPKAQLFCDLPPTTFDSSTLPASILADKTVRVTGRVAARASISYQNQALGGNLSATLSGGRVEAGKTLLSGIDLKLTLPDIPRIQSDPGQVGSIEKLEFGNITMSDASFTFRLEDATTVFLEGLKLSWCGGRVETGSLSLTPTAEHLETTLYCDRLGLTRLLGQFGIENAEGNGSLNGKLPIRIGPAGVSVDDGFLFSTPGDSGILRFGNSPQLRQAMGDSQGTPSLDYARQSLGDFSYNWTRLTFTSIGEELLLAMELDGKPTTPLPFGYKNGQIIGTDSGPGLQHPLRLDVNFRFSLRDLFTLGKNYQSLMEDL